MRRLILAPLVAVLATPIASAQNQNLAGIEHVGLLVNGLDRSNTGCGVTEGAVRRTVSGAFQQHDVTVGDDSEPIVASVRVSTTLDGSGRCASAYEIALTARIEVAPSALEAPVTGLLSLWTEARAVDSDRPDHLDAVTAGLSSLATDLAIQIRLANPSASTVVERPGTQPPDDPAYRIARCQELLSSPRLIPLETRIRDLDELQCEELVIAPE